MPTIAGGINVFPSLEDMSSLFRSMINDDGSGQSGPTGGQIAYDTSPFMLPFMNSAMRDLYSDLRIVGDQELIYDNYILEGLPVVNGPNGQGVADPTAQVYIGINGYFDGTQMWPDWTLPIYTRNITRMWERQTGSDSEFCQMRESQFGLTPTFQGALNGVWEYRQGAAWMPGAVAEVDIRIRGTIAFVDFISVAGSLNFSTTYFPIQDSTNAIVDKMLVRYARRFAPDQLPAATQSAAESLFKLQQEIVRRRQTVEYTRADWAAGEYNLPWSSQL